MNRFQYLNNTIYLLLNILTIILLFAIFFFFILSTSYLWGNHDWGYPWWTPIAMCGAAAFVVFLWKIAKYFYQTNKNF